MVPGGPKNPGKEGEVRSALSVARFDRGRRTEHPLVRELDKLAGGLYARHFRSDRAGILEFAPRPHAQAV